MSWVEVDIKFQSDVVHCTCKVSCATERTMRESKRGGFLVCSFMFVWGVVCVCVGVGGVGGGSMFVLFSYLCI